MRILYTASILLFLELLLTSCCKECDKNTDIAFSEEEKSLVYLDQKPLNWQETNVYKNPSGDSIVTFNGNYYYETTERNSCQCENVSKVEGRYYSSAVEYTYPYNNIFEINSYKSDDRDFEIRYTIGGLQAYSVQTINTMVIGGKTYNSLQFCQAANSILIYKGDTLKISSTYFSNKDGLVKFVEEGNIDWIKQ